MYRWIYNAIIYDKSDGEVFAEKRCNTNAEAEHFIEENIEQFETFNPTGHVTKDYVRVSYK